jgi:hypothetical protein
MILLGNNGLVGNIIDFDYTKNIKLYLEQEKLRMIGHALKQGISEETIEKLLKE